MRRADYAVTGPDVNAFASACGVESERLGSGAGCLGSSQRVSDFAGVLQAEIAVCGKLFCYCILSVCLLL